MTVSKSSKSTQKNTVHEDLRNLIFLLDDMFCGKKGGRKGRRDFYTSLLTALATDDMALLTYTQDLLQKDLERPHIRRDFLDFTGTPHDIFQILAQEQGFGTLLPFVLSLSSLVKDEDLLTDMVTLGRNIDAQRQYRLYKEYVSAIQQKKRAQITNLRVFEGVRDIANKFSLVGTGVALPQVTLTISEDASELNKIFEAIKRYPVYEEIETVLKALHTDFDQLLDDIQDIFTDYSQGELRRTALKKFPIYCRKMTNLTAD